MIIDSNVHITPDGRWFSTYLDASVNTLLHQMDESGVEKAVVVGLPDYIPNQFVLDVCRKFENRFFPVASFNPIAYESMDEVALQAKNQLLDAGYVGVKLHPRFSRYNPLDTHVLSFLDELASWKNPLPVWLCTFFHFPGGVLSKSPVEIIHELVGRYPNIAFVLAHGGGSDILRLAQAVRHSPNAVLDLSYTLSKFLGSSIEMDIKYLLKTFDQRLVLGSDFPEVSLSQSRSDFNKLTIDVCPKNYDNVSGLNLLRLIGTEVL